MGNAARRQSMTEGEYLALEASSPTRHEYVRGEVFAMAGVTGRHNEVTANLHAGLRAHLRGGPCRTYLVDVKLHVAQASAFFYPDVFVTCDPVDSQDPLVKRHAKLVIEVTSPSTADYDRGEKFRDYRRLESLEEYVVVEVQSRRVDVFHRRPDGVWEFESASEDESVVLRSVDLRLELAQVYDDTDVPLRLSRPES